jgi:cytochrome d ubiquinol oxidase subunit II
MLIPVLGRNDTERRVIVNTIGPVWDGNEVWLLVAGGATFAAFPEWYATLFSGFYLALLVILVALIVRGVAFEFRGKVDTPQWRNRWDAAIVFGSAVPALLWGVAFANIVRGVPIRPQGSPVHLEYVGNFFTLLNPYALLGGLTTLTLFLTHGAVYLALKTTGDLRARAHQLAWQIGLVAAVLAVAFLAWSQAYSGHVGATIVLAVVTAGAFVGGLVANRMHRDGWAFVGTAVAIAGAVATLFVGLFPNVMPSSLAKVWNLTVHNASSTPYTLKVMTVVAVIFTPIVLIYQGWTFYVFRRRLSVEQIPEATPLETPSVSV